MKEKILKVFKRKSGPSSDFSAFFVESKAKEKKELIKVVVRQANEDQRRLSQQAERMAAAN